MIIQAVDAHSTQAHVVIHEFGTTVDGARWRVEVVGNEERRRGVKESREDFGTARFLWRQSRKQRPITSQVVGWDRPIISKGPILPERYTRRFIHLYFCPDRRAEFSRREFSINRSECCLKGVPAVMFAPELLVCLHTEMTTLGHRQMTSCKGAPVLRTTCRTETPQWGPGQSSTARKLTALSC